MKVLKRLGTVLAIAPLLALVTPVAAHAQHSEAVVATSPLQSPANTSRATTASSTPTASTLNWSSTASTTTSSSSTSAGPAASAVALRMKPAATEEAAPLPRGGRADSKALMIVGLAAVVTGIVVGDDAGTILILGGAGVGLYGLYKYMQ